MTFPSGSARLSGIIGRSTGANRMIWKRKKPDQPETATPGSESGDSPQLSPVEGVPNDMSSMAIGGAFPRTSDVSSSQPVRYSDPQSLTGLDDAQVMLRVRDGDDAAFNYLVERYRRAMISFMFRMVHNAAIAEELAQEVFLRVYRSRSSYAADAKFTTWLYRIATNLAVNHARDHKHERPEEKASLDAVDEDTGLSIDVADDRPNVEQEIVAPRAPARHPPAGRGPARAPARRGHDA